MSNNQNYIIYYNENNGFNRCYFSETKEIKSFEKLPENIHRYHLLNGYEATDEGLIKYNDDFKNWVEEIKNETNFNYINSYNDNKAVWNFFYYCSSVKKLFNNGKYKNNIKKEDENKEYKKYIDTFEDIDKIENKWIDACYNAGLMYFDNVKKVIDIHSYDFNLKYPNALTSENLIIPIKKGTEYNLKELPNELRYGYYHVKITSINEETQEENPNIRKIMSFSKNNVYTSLTIEYLRKHKDEFNIKIELIQDDKPNAYLYSKACGHTITGNKLCGDWLKKLKSMREKYNNNKLVKYLGSTLWGTLTERNKLNVNQDELKNYEIEIKKNKFVDSNYKLIDIKYRHDMSHYYVIEDMNKPYKRGGIARVKPFLTSICRNDIAAIAMIDINNIIRIQTDCASFSQKQNINLDDKIKYETKSSGLMYFRNVNSYLKIKQNNNGYYFDDNNYFDINNLDEVESAYLEHKHN